MNFTWILGLLILSQQVSTHNHLLITNNGHPISSIERANFSINSSGLPIMNTEKLNQLMNQIDQKVSKTPKNAIIDKNGNIIPEQVGYRLNRDYFTEKVFSYFFNNESTNLEVPLQVVYPSVDSEILGTIRSEKIGEYITTFNSKNRERNHNIYLAAKAINNFVLFPGETFSFNQVVGERTAGKDICQLLSLLRGIIGGFRWWNLPGILYPFQRN